MSQVINRLNELEKSKKLLDDLTDELKRRAISVAKAEREYRQELAKKQMQLKTRGNNFPANMVSDLSRGDDIVSRLRYTRDIAKIEYDVCKEKLRDERMQIEILRSLIAFDRVTYSNS